MLNIVHDCSECGAQNGVWNDIADRPLCFECEEEVEANIDDWLDYEAAMENAMDEARID